MVWVSECALNHHHFQLDPTPLKPSNQPTNKRPSAIHPTHPLSAVFSLGSLRGHLVMARAHYFQRPSLLLSLLLSLCLSLCEEEKIESGVG